MYKYSIKNQHSGNTTVSTTASRRTCMMYQKPWEYSITDTYNGLWQTQLTLTSWNDVPHAQNLVHPNGIHTVIIILNKGTKSSLDTHAYALCTHKE